MRNLVTLLLIGAFTLVGCTKETIVNEYYTYNVSAENNPFGADDSNATEVSFNVVPIKTGNTTSSKQSSFGKANDSSSSKGIASSSKDASEFVHALDDAEIALSREGGGKTYLFRLSDQNTVRLPKGESFSYIITSDRNDGRNRSFYLPYSGTGTFTTGTEDVDSVDLNATTEYGLITIQAINETTISSPRYDGGSMKERGELFFVYAKEGIEESISFDWSNGIYTGTGSSEKFTVEAYNHYEYAVDVNVTVEENSVVSGATSVGFTIVLDEFTTDGQTVVLVEHTVQSSTTVSDGDEGVFGVTWNDEDVLTITSGSALSGWWFIESASLPAGDSFTVYAINGDEYSLVDTSNPLKQPYNNSGGVYVHAGPDGAALSVGSKVIFIPNE